LGPYSHIVIANELESYINPANLEEYYWGAVAPDVRYLVKDMTKKQTHIPTDKILELMTQHPHQMPFLQGYLVHCLTDQLNLKRIIRQKFPFNLVSNRITRGNSSILLEFLNIELLKPIKISLSGKNNQILKEAGIKDNLAIKYAQEINKYINTLSLTASFNLYNELGFENSKKIEKYSGMVKRWQSSWFKNNLILILPQLKKLNKEIATLLQSKIHLMVNNKSRDN
jgi:hypothetical protein